MCYIDACVVVCECICENICVYLINKRRMKQQEHKKALQKFVEKKNVLLCTGFMYINTCIVVSNTFLCFRSREE